MSHEVTEREKLLAGVPAQEGKDIDAGEVLAQANEAMKNRWLAILIQLTNSHRFNKFIEDNYSIGDSIDEEQRTIETLVIEKPIAVGPPLTSSQLTAFQALLKREGVKATVLDEILAILGQQDVSLITTATVNDIQLAKQQADLKKKLDS